MNTIITTRVSVLLHPTVKHRAMVCIGTTYVATDCVVFTLLLQYENQNSPCLQFRTERVCMLMLKQSLLYAALPHVHQRAGSPVRN